MTTIRVAKRRRFTQIDRNTLNDVRLSYRARGVLAYLLDKPDDWTTNSDAIAVAGREGREAIRSALAELEEHGYLERKKWRGKLGQWQSEWTVRERPKGTEPRRVPGAGDPPWPTSAGEPPRIPGPQIPETETAETVLGDSRFQPLRVEVCSRCRSFDECRCNELKEGTA